MKIKLKTSTISIKLYHANCFSVMKNIASNSVDMVLTDPPYGMEFISNYRIKKYAGIVNDNNLQWFTELTEDIIRD